MSFWSNKAAGRNINQSVASLRGQKNKASSQEQFADPDVKTVKVKPNGEGKAVVGANTKGTGKENEPSSVALAGKRKTLSLQKYGY